MKICDFFDLEKSICARLIEGCEYPWDALDMLHEYIRRVGRSLSHCGFSEVKREVWIERSATVSDSAVLTPPIIIDRGAAVGEGSVIRSSVIGKGAFIGSFCEIYGSVFFDGARAPHNNYVSDSVVGYKARFGAGAIVSNRSADRREICCLFGNEIIRLGKRKFGALVGDRAEIGCSSVLMAGCTVEPRAFVSPLTRARGFVGSGGAESLEKIAFDVL